MAQQTRIATLLPYYERFMERFPTVRALAAAEIGDLLKAWEGLGYYSRAHNLHKAACIVVERYGGELPDDPVELQTLPGIGAYTAGAIASIAFGKPVPAIDGNALRVFSRIEANHADISLPATKTSLSSYLKKIFPTESGEARAFAQAIMELGALICLPGRPNCEGCPVHEYCKAFACGIERELPVKSPKKPQRTEEKTVLIVLASDSVGAEKILMRCRTEKLLHGLWEFCVQDGAMDESAVREYLASIGLVADGISQLGAARHVFTHVIWNMTGHLCRVAAAVEPEEYRWIPRERLGEVAVPTALAFYRKQARVDRIEGGVFL